MATRLPATWSGRLGLLVAALGLVLMHHVVGAHQHSAAGTVPIAASGMSAPSIEHGAGTDGHHPAGHNALRPGAGAVLPGVDSSSSAALLHDHSSAGGQGHASSLLHMCLATLVGAMALLVLLLVASRFASQASVGARVAAGIVPRPPPTPTRLAQLQVLRL